MKWVLFTWQLAHQFPPKIVFYMPEAEPVYALPGSFKGS